MALLHTELPADLPRLWLVKAGETGSMAIRLLAVGDDSPPGTDAFMLLGSDGALRASTVANGPGEAIPLQTGITDITNYTAVAVRHLLASAADLVEQLVVVAIGDASETRMVVALAGADVSALSEQALTLVMAQAGTAHVALSTLTLVVVHPTAVTNERIGIACTIRFPFANPIGTLVAASQAEEAHNDDVVDEARWRFRYVEAANAPSLRYLTVARV